MRWREKPFADLLRRNQAVAVAVRLSNKCRMVRVGLNLLAKPEDKVVHRPCQRHIRVSPHEMKQFVPGYYMSGSLGEAASGRRWGTTTSVANLYADTSVADFVFTPDLSQPIYHEESDKAAGFRLTLQATSKDKFTFSHDRQKNFQDQLTGQLETGTIKNEANPGYCNSTT
jgi:hypothetical protein